MISKAFEDSFQDEYFKNKNLFIMETLIIAELFYK